MIDAFFSFNLITLCILINRFGSAAVKFPALLLSSLLKWIVKIFVWLRLVQGTEIKTPVSSCKFPSVFPTYKRNTL